MLAPLCFQVYGQEEKDEKFTNIGAIAISDKYTLPKNRRAIIFRIKNNTTRSISQIFGKVFMINKEASDPRKKYRPRMNLQGVANVLICQAWFFGKYKIPF